MKELERLIQDKGFSLKGAGVNNFGLTRNDALKILSSSEILDVVILGGDVFNFSNGSAILSYDNWSFDPVGEINIDLPASIERAINYITTYRVSVVLFTLTLDR